MRRGSGPRRRVLADTQSTNGTTHRCNAAARPSGTARGPSIHRHASPQTGRRGRHVGARRWVNALARIGRYVQDCLCAGKRSRTRVKIVDLLPRSRDRLAPVQHGCGVRGRTIKRRSRRCLSFPVSGDTGKLCVCVRSVRRSNQFLRGKKSGFNTMRRQWDTQTDTNRFPHVILCLCVLQLCLRGAIEDANGLQRLCQFQNKTEQK